MNWLYELDGFASKSKFNQKQKKGIPSGTKTAKRSQKKRKTNELKNVHQSMQYLASIWTTNCEILHQHWEARQGPGPNISASDPKVPRACLCALRLPSPHCTLPLMLMLVFLGLLAEGLLNWVLLGHEAPPGVYRIGWQKTLIGWTSFCAICWIVSGSLRCSVLVFVLTCLHHVVEHWFCINLSLIWGWILVSFFMCRWWVSRSRIQPAQPHPYNEFACF